jgi:pantoate--beta-alanine ligase
MRILRRVDEVRDALREPRERGERIGLVPTMGAFHAGHLALIRAARESCDLVVVSLFVNPTQFNAPDDLARYPRDEAADARAADDGGGRPPLRARCRRAVSGRLRHLGRARRARPRARGGKMRPGHFRGVATICTKLFAIVQPHAAIFGRKDAQQVAVMKRLVTDLNLPIEIVAVPTVRDPDGLALSSRNVFLSPDERRRALALPRALDAGLAAHRSGGDPVGAARAVLEAEPQLEVNYVAIADLDGPALAAAVRVGRTRLIDNVRLEDD